MTSEEMTALFTELDALPTGERTALKREAGIMLDQADGRAARVFYQCLPPTTKPWEEERAFAAACLHCLWGAETAGRVPLERILYQLGRERDLSDSMGHRVESLLDLPWDEDGFLLTKLARLIRLIRSKGWAVDCQALLEDLLRWNGDRQTVQRKWARALYIEPEA